MVRLTADAFRPWLRLIGGNQRPPRRGMVSAVPSHLLGRRNIHAGVTLRGPGESHAHRPALTRPELSSTTGEPFTSIPRCGRPSGNLQSSLQLLQAVRGPPAAGERRFLRRSPVHPPSGLDALQFVAMRRRVSPVDAFPQRLGHAALPGAAAGVPATGCGSRCGVTPSLPRDPAGIADQGSIVHAGRPTWSRSQCYPPAKSTSTTKPCVIRPKAIHSLLHHPAILAVSSPEPVGEHEADDAVGSVEPGFATPALPSGPPLPESPLPDSAAVPKAALGGGSSSRGRKLCSDAQASSIPVAEAASRLR